MIKKRFSFLLSILLIISMFPLGALTAQAAKNHSYVALGDSISTGYGLENKTAQGFAYLLAKENGYDLTNLAVDGNTTVGVLAQLDTKAVQAAVANADLITLTIGGNDLMAILYQSVADAYNATQTSDANKITVADVLPIMSAESDDRKLSLMLLTMELLTPTSEIYLMNSPAFQDALTAYLANLNRIMEIIHTSNADATVIVATQYNPYVEFDGEVFIFFDLSCLYQGMEAGVTALNEAITSNAANGGYSVADVKKVFDNADVDPYVADPTTLELDFHPNAAGHALIAETIASALPPEAPDVPKTGDSAALWIALLPISLMGTAFVAFQRKRAFN